MYVTRPLWKYLDNSDAAAEPPPEGPGSGFLVVVDETGEHAMKRCWGCCVDREMRALPFPQNRRLALQEKGVPEALESCVEILGGILEILANSSDGGGGGGGKTAAAPYYVMLVPLSSGHSSVVRADDRHMG